MDQDGIVVNASDFHSSNPRSFSGRRKHNLLFKVAVNLLLENNEVEGVGGRGGSGERQNVLFFFVIWKALIIGGWVVVVWGRKSYLGSAEISSFVYLV